MEQKLNTNSMAKNLEIRPAGCDWSDFIPEDKRAYSKNEYDELISLLEVVKNEPT